MTEQTGADIILSMDNLLKDIMSTQHDMLATESVRLASQAAMFHQQPTTATTTDCNAASAAASCFYKHKIINELKAGAQRARAHSEFSGDHSDSWHEKYYSTPPALVPNPNHFNSINHTKHYSGLPARMDQNAAVYGNNPYQHYHQPAKSGSYYPSALPTNAAGAQATNMLHWQQSLHQQQQASQQLQQKLNHTPLTPQQDDVFSSQTNNRFTDMFLRSQHPGYFLSFNETSPSWCQTSAASKESFFQPPITKNICPLCGKNYARPSTLKTHMRIHSGERPFHCKVCNKSFSQAANLTAHLRVHSGEKPFACSICHKTFSQSSSVTTHMRTHSGDRPYKCPICRKGFSDSSTLTKHLRIHSGEKPYRCTFCSMSFSQSGNLNRHMKVHEHHRKHDSPSSSSKPSPQ